MLAKEIELRSGLGFEVQVAAARQGDRLQLGRLLDVYRNYLLKLATEKQALELVVKEAPSDLVQETLLEATQSFSEFRGTTEIQLREWLRQILTRNVIDVGRNFRDAAKRDVSLEVPFHHADEAQNRRSNMPAVSDPPSKRLREAEEANKLQLALQKLSDEKRQVIQLRVYEQLCFEEIGVRLGTSRETVRRLWASAIQTLAGELESNERDSV